MKQFARPEFWSNLFFIVPFSIALYKGYFLYAPFMILAAFFSLLYHYSAEKKFVKLDKFFAILLFVANAIAIAIAGFPLLYTLIAIIFSILSYITFKLAQKNYQLYHSLWHIVVTAIATTCVLAL